MFPLYYVHSDQYSSLKYSMMLYLDCAIHSVEVSSWCLYPWCKLTEHVKGNYVPEKHIIILNSLYYSKSNSSVSNCFTAIESVKNKKYSIDQ